MLENRDASSQFLFNDYYSAYEVYCMNMLSTKWPQSTMVLLLLCLL